MPRAIVLSTNQMGQLVSALEDMHAILSKINKVLDQSGNVTWGENETRIPPDETDSEPDNIRSPRY